MKRAPTTENLSASIALARAQGWRWYLTPSRPCPDCRDVRRSVEDDSCMVCLLRRLRVDCPYPYGAGAAVRAAEAGLRAYCPSSAPQMCGRGHHVYAVDLRTHRCIGCDQERRDSVARGITYEQAVAEGLRHYRTDEPCARGHDAPRYTSTRDCVECARERRAGGGGVDLRTVRAPLPDILLVERAEAARRGLEHYRTGRPCARGHDAPRYVSTGQCIACARMRPEERTSETVLGRPRGPTPDAPTIRREDARALGFVHYRTGRPCTRGHDAPRYVSTGQCLECCRPTARRVDVAI